jgi:hypothetical protein
MLFHFQFSGKHGWESMGSGVSSGDDLLATAVEDLRLLHGGKLPAGSYRYIAARRGAQMSAFEIDRDGELRD